jgi:hypothetical protein
MMDERDHQRDEPLIGMVSRTWAPAPRSAEQRRSFAAALERRTRRGRFIAWQPVPVFAMAAALALVVWLAGDSPSAEQVEVAGGSSGRGEVLVALALDDEVGSSGDELPDDLALLADVIGF